MSYFQDVRTIKNDPTNNAEQAKFIRRNADEGAEVHVNNTVTVTGTVTPGTTTGTLANGTQTAVSSAAVQILASNASRKTAVVQNTGTANIRVGVAAVAATTGLQLTPGAVAIYEEPHVPTQALFAIREGGVDSVAFAQEVV